MSDMTPENRLLLTKATMSILDSWKLGAKEMNAVLGLPREVRARGLQKFRSHESFPDDPGVDRRADYILRIAGALRTTNPNMAPIWLRRAHRRLGRTPLSLLLQEGEGGLVRVLAELDCTVCWDLTDARFTAKG